MPKIRLDFSRLPEPPLTPSIISDDIRQLERELKYRNIELKLEISLKKHGTVFWDSKSKEEGYRVLHEDKLKVVPLIERDFKLRETIYPTLQKLIDKVADILHEEKLKEMELKKEKTNDTKERAPTRRVVVRKRDVVPKPPRNR